ncbi:MAG: hypothetical protein CL849_05220 [Crocinitomicaceae bacterium]|nr:hypothetical protein [Crocinitomicaceae bacterium]
MGTNTRRKEGRIGERIAIAQSDDSLKVDIHQQIPPVQMMLLTLWLVSWMALEVLVLYFWTQEPNEGNAWLGYAIYSAFWGFFAFRIGKVWMWRRVGREVLVVDRKGISIAMAFGERGLPDFFAHGTYTMPSRIEANPQQILQTFEKAFWSMGGETLQFSSGKRTMVLGKQLSEQHASALLKLIQGAVRRLNPN